MEEEPKIGVYVCHCGTNIAAVVDVKEVVEYAKSLPNVALAKESIYTCSSPTQEAIKQDIKEHGLNRVVIASCTPKMHEPTFREVVREGGLNPYLYEQANIREQCSWVHSSDPEEATKKAKDLVRMAIAKVRLLKPLEIKEMDVTLKAVVIGGGVTGLRSAIDLTERGFDVHLIEKSPTLGGRSALLYSLVRSERKAPEVVTELIDKVTSSDRITIYTLSSVSKMDGFLGNFELEITQKPRYIKPCSNCLKCVDVCPIETENEYEYGISKRKAIYLPFKHAYPPYPSIDMEVCNKCGKCVEVCEEKAIDLDQDEDVTNIKAGVVIVATGAGVYEPEEGEFGYKKDPRVLTLLQLERFLDENGPIGGEVTIGQKPIKNAVFIGCVGSRKIKKSEDERGNEFCSRVCCTATIKNALALKKRYPEANVFFLYRDIRTYGRDEYLYKEASESKVTFMKYVAENPPLIERFDGELTVTVQDVLSNDKMKIPSDLVILSVGMEPRKDAHDLASILKITRSGDGFFQEAHAKLRPFDTANEGVYLAGACQGPKNIIESIASGSAAAAKASIPLAKGKVELEPTRAMITEFCDGCAICVDPCIGKAITLVEYEVEGEIKKKIEINEALCLGCGVCQATCPKRGIVIRHFTFDQISAMIDAALAG
ncbi:MAG: FAD-dependent oxidoreductase [Candidatus Hydrothermarchaeales archaeon]